MRPYLVEAGGHHKQALALYRWNSEVSAAFLVLLSLAEVVTRNAFNERLSEWCRRNAGPHDWLIDHAAGLPHPLDKLLSSVVAGAHDKATDAKSDRDANTDHPRCGQPLNDGDVLAQITFGHWHRIVPWDADEIADPTTNGYRRRIWDEALVDVFPPGTDPDEIRWTLYRLAYFRNRVAHHENVLGSSLIDRRADVLKLLRLIDPVVYDWATGQDRVPHLLKRKPQ